MTNPPLSRLSRISAALLLAVVLLPALFIGHRCGATAALLTAHAFSTWLFTSPILGTNAIASALQRVAKLNAIMRGFKRRFTPIMAFAMRAEGTPLEGTDEIAVPYYPLDTVASKDFVTANGYVFDQDSDTQSKKVTINKRKYKPLKLTSAELRRQPALDPEMLLEIKGEKLAEDVCNDVFSVVTAANFGASVKVGLATAFDSDDIIDLRQVANDLHWPVSGRGLVVDTTFGTNLLKDVSIKNADRFGGAEAIRDGRVPNVLGFNYFEVPSLPTNAETLTGFIAYQSAVLVGFAPIAPTPEVMKLLSAYELMSVEVAPGVTIMLEYRAWGNADFDESREVVECNYGYLKGEAAALRRITTA